MKFGYARISTAEQSLDVQIDALKKAGCDDVVTDQGSGIKEDRPGLREVMRMLREGDTLVVVKLDRLGRNMKHLIETLNDLEQRKISFVSLSEDINTQTVMGKLMFHLIASLAEFERGLAVERTLAGLAAARARGRFGGRPFTLDKRERLALITMYNNKKIKIADICKLFKLSKASIYRYVNIAKAKEESAKIKAQRRKQLIEKGKILDSLSCQN